MDSLLELLIGIFAVGIYGFEGKPRHPFWRNSLRFFVFLGAGFALFHMMLFDQVPDVHILISVAWGLGFLIVFSAEYYLGKPWLSVAAAITGIVLLFQALHAEGVI